jgi:hypothetical protein
MRLIRRRPGAWLLGRDITADPAVQDALRSAQQRVAEATGFSVELGRVRVRTGGLWRRVYRLSGATGMTLGNTMNVTHLALVTHELVHVYQWQTKRMGYLADYLRQWLKVGYAGVSYEREAYRIADGQPGPETVSTPRRA